MHVTIEDYSSLWLSQVTVHLRGSSTQGKTWMKRGEDPSWRSRRGSPGRRRRRKDSPSRGSWPRPWPPPWGILLARETSISHCTLSYIGALTTNLSICWIQGHFSWLFVQEFIEFDVVKNICASIFLKTQTSKNLLASFARPKFVSFTCIASLGQHQQQYACNFVGYLFNIDVLHS